MKHIQKCLAENLRAFRAEKGLSQAEVARATGIAIASIKRLETQNAWPELDTVERFAKLYGVTTVELFQVRKPPR